jgi:hypothetical protein
MPTARDYGRLDALTTITGDAFDVEDRERHTGVIVASLVLGYRRAQQTGCRVMSAFLSFGIQKPACRNPALPERMARIATLWM